MAAMSGEVGYYEVLGVDPTASAEDIRRAYMQLARALHPDKNDSAEAHETLAKVGEAWSVLKNKQLRKIYDRDGKDGLPDEVYSSDEDDDDDEVDDDDDEEDGPLQDEGDGTQNLASFFSVGGAQARSTPRGPTDPQNARGGFAHATAIPGAESGDTTSNAIDHHVALQIADAVAESIRRTEKSAAARYQRALSSLLRAMNATLSLERADEMASEAWRQASPSDAT